MTTKRSTKGSGGVASSGARRGKGDPGPSTPGDKARQTSHLADSIKYNAAHAKSHLEEAAKARVALKKAAAKVSPKHPAVAKETARLARYKGSK